jgi:RNA polymerase sigma-70 factor (ECF subfamily)
MAGKLDPWSVWLDEHGPALVLLARQWAPRHADAEDVVQEALVRCWRSRDRISDLTAYLYTCVRNGALDWQRGRRRQRRRESAVARADCEPMLVAPVEQEERRVAIEAAVRRLPAAQAEVLVMKIWGGLSLPQIAAAVGTSTNTAASRYRYALAALREQLAEETIR